MTAIRGQRRAGLAWIMLKSPTTIYDKTRPKYTQVARCRSMSWKTQLAKMRSGNSGGGGHRYLHPCRQHKTCTWNVGKCGVLSNWKRVLAGDITTSYSVRPLYSGAGNILCVCVCVFFFWGGSFHLSPQTNHWRTQMCRKQGTQVQDPGISKIRSL